MSEAPVVIIGTGLLGTSIALGLTARGRKVFISDSSPTVVAIAHDLGAGELLPTVGTVQPDLVVVAVPPDATATVVFQALQLYPGATVTDVSSVKGAIAQQIERAGKHAAIDISRYVGGHPMAGRERSGPTLARADLCTGQPWVICPRPDHDPARVEQVRQLATALSAYPVTMSAFDHDRAVSLVSHVPQLVASAMAASMVGAEPQDLSLAGGGLRDLTRIADSDPVLWAQIVSANAGAIEAALARVIDHLTDIHAAVGELGRDADAVGPRAQIAQMLSAGNLGRSVIPGKHGAPPIPYAVVAVVIPDEPGALARLFADIARAQLNVEEVRLEHAPGRAVGILEISVAPAAERALVTMLRAQHWQQVG